MKRSSSIGWWGLAGVAIVAMTAMWLPRSAPAEEATASTAQDVSRFAGTFKYGKSLDHGRRIVRQAIDKAIDDLPLIYRGLARRRLADSDPLVHKIIIALPGDQISVTYIGEKRATFSTKRGAKQKVKNLQGNEVDLTQRFVNGRLEQIWVGPNGRSRALYSLSDDNKRLVVATTTAGKKLNSTISYKLGYVRQ
jgi:hypothetical protein